MTKEEIKTMDKELTDFYKEREEDFDKELAFFMGELKGNDGTIEPISIQEY
jgi:hypothetical protein